MSSSDTPASRRSTSTRSIASSALVSSSVVATLLAGTVAAAPVAQASSQVEQARLPRAAAAAPVVDGENDGPHSPVNRKRAATTTVRRAGAVIRDVDLGDVELGERKGQFRSPVRGVLVTPDRPRASAPLVIMSHLRSPGCADDVSAFPCPGKDVRYDRGMTYLGESLAKQGYSVLIPDLAPLFIGIGMAQPYDQQAGYRTIVGRLRDETVAASAGRATAFGKGLNGAIDARRTALIVHSRSAYVAGPLVQAWSRSRSPIVSVMAYGGAFDAPDDHGRFTPMIPDVPFLGIVGDRDRDTKFTGQLWLTQHAGASRRTPALMSVVPGLGHNYVNRALSSTRLDDRAGCDATCPGPAAHERFLSSAARQWLDATVRRTRTTLPMTAAAPLPTTLGGLPARWLAVTNGPRVNAYLGGMRGSMRPIGRGGSVRPCLYVDPMNPAKPANACPEPQRGDVQNASRVARVTVTPSGGVRVAARTRGVRELVLQLSPNDDRADRRAGSPLRVTVRTASGRPTVIDVPATHPALRNRAGRDANGTYSIGTIRLMLPRSVTASTVTGIDLTGGSASSSLDIRAVDLVTG